MSVILTDKIQPRTTGIALTVVGDMDVTGNISVAGTVTYEDVTNVDSLGIITARTGLRVTAGGVVINAGVSTFANTLNITGGEVKVGAAFSVSQAGVVTATSYYGDGSNLSNITSTTINNNADNRLITGSGTANTLEGESTLTYNGSTLALTGDQTISSKLTIGTGITIGSAGVATFADGSATSNGLHFGSGGDLKLYHNGSNAHIKNATGSFTIDNTSGDLILQAKAGENSVYCIADGAVNLYYNNGKTLETTPNGVTIYDDGKNDEGRLIVQGGEGSAATLYLYSDDGDDNADKWRLLNENTGEFKIQNYTSGSWETNFKGIADGASVLYHNNTNKFETSNDGTVTTGISTATAFVPTEGQLSNRNIIINGDMSIWQRGTTSINTSANKYLVDRFKALSVTDGDASIHQHSNVPTNAQTGGITFAYSLRVNCTTADTSLAANQYIIISQRIEGHNLRHLGFGLAGTRYATLQFWQRSPAGTYHVSFRNASYNRYYLGSYTIASSNTWEKHSITIPIDTSGTWGAGNSTGLDIQWSLGSGAATGTVGSWTGGSSHAGTGQFNFFGTVGNDFYLTGVQFEAGSVVTPFESIDYTSQLAKCQRYFYPINAPEGFIDATEDLGIGWANSATEVQMRVNCPVQMRATPTLRQTTSTNYWIIGGGNYGGDKYISNQWNVNNLSPSGGNLYVAPDAGLGSYIGQVATIQSKSTAARLALESEI